jgi:hypothetical protein
MTLKGLRGFYKTAFMSAMKEKIVQRMGFLKMKGVNYVVVSTNPTSRDLGKT